MTVNLIVGDSLTELRRLPSDSIDMCVTSPPYWGLRDYGVEGQLGLEPTLGEHIANLVELFEEVRRVLKPHGSLWLNYGDCYATSPNGRSAAETKAAGNDDRTFRDKPFSTVGPVYDPEYRKRTTGGIHADRREDSGGRVVAGGYLKPKDLCMIPNRLAIALQDAGWWVRSEIVWGKPNAMPDSSGAYRPSVAHEKIFLLTKSGDADIWRARDTGELSFSPDLSEKCPLVTRPDKLAPRWSRIGSYYDAGSLAMPVSENTNARVSRDVASQKGSDRANGGRKTNGSMKAVGCGPKSVAAGAHKNKGNDSFNSSIIHSVSQRYARNYERDMSAIVPPEVWEIPTASFSGAHFATFPPALVAPCVMAGSPKGGSVLDPFGGSGTTALVAERLGRDSILIELNPEYAQITRDRLRSKMITMPGPQAASDGALFDYLAESGKE